MYITTVYIGNVRQTDKREELARILCQFGAEGHVLVDWTDSN